jgi:hypothetical protein
MDSLMKLLNPVIPYLALIALAACSPSEPPAQAQGSLKDIAGLYNISQRLDRGTFTLEDIAFFHITDEGVIYIYDYLGDSHQRAGGSDSVKKCYHRKQTANIAHLSNNSYQITEADKEPEQLNIQKLSDGSLSVTYQGSDSQTFAVSSKTLAQLTPICNESDPLSLIASADTKPKIKDDSILPLISKVIWDTSGTYSNGITDEYYLHISSDGQITDYDYAGDSFDNLDNCYYVIQDSKFVAVENNERGTDQFRLNFMDKPVSDFTVTLALDASGNLVITNEGVSETLPRTRLSLADMQPGCE